MKFVIVLASAMLLVQLVTALPLEKHSTEDDSTEKIDPQFNLGVYVLSEVAKIGKWILGKGGVVVNNAVKDLLEIPDKDELLQANITRMSKIGKEAAEFEFEDNEESVMNLFENMVSFADMIADYQNMPENSKLKQTLKRALENNDYVKFDSELKEKFIALAKESDEVFTEYLKSLSAVERLKQSKLINWYNDFVAETNEEKKLEKFGEIFNMLN